MVLNKSVLKPIEINVDSGKAVEGRAVSKIRSASQKLIVKIYIECFPNYVSIFIGSKYFDYCNYFITFKSYVTLYGMVPSILKTSTRDKAFGTRPLVVSSTLNIPLMVP